MGAILWYEPVAKKLQDAAQATGNGEIFDLAGKFGSLTVQVSGAFSGAVTFEASVDGKNFVAIRGMNKNTGSSASTATGAGIFQFSVAGIVKFRARISACTSGSITVDAVATAINEPALPAASTTAAMVAIDQSTSGTTNKVVAELTGIPGRISEYAWITGDTPPTPLEGFAWGYEFDPDNGTVTKHGWSGQAWVDIVEQEQ